MEKLRQDPMLCLGVKGLDDDDDDNEFLQVLQRLLSVSHLCVS
jgi:hypothetical protein